MNLRSHIATALTAVATASLLAGCVTTTPPPQTGEDVTSLKTAAHSLVVAAKDVAGRCTGADEVGAVTAGADVLETILSEPDPRDKTAATHYTRRVLEQSTFLRKHMETVEANCTAVLESDTEAAAFTPETGVIVAAPTPEPAGVAVATTPTAPVPTPNTTPDEAAPDPSPAAETTTPQPTTHRLQSRDCADPWKAQDCVDAGGIITANFTEWFGPIWVGGHASGPAQVIAQINVGDKVQVVGSTAEGMYVADRVQWVKKEPIDVADMGTATVLQVCVGDQMRLVWLHSV